MIRKSSSHVSGRLLCFPSLERGLEKVKVEPKQMFEDGLCKR